MGIKQLSVLHDARLVGVSYLADSSIRLDFEIGASVKKSVLLQGVVNFFCSGMLEGNIVDSVEVIDADDVSQEDLNFFVEKEGRGQKADVLKNKIDNSRLSMVLVSPSYGAELGCICAGVVQQ